MRIRAVISALISAAILSSAGPAFAQTWPSKPVRIIVPFAPGGATDVTGRLIAEGLRKKTGQTFIVENKPGATGAIGAQEVASAPADGSTLLVMINSFFSLTPHFVKVSIDPNKDLTAITETSRNAMVLVGNPSLPAKTVPELVAHVKANKGKMTYASPSAGTVFHLGGLLLNDLAGTDLAPVQYKGSGPAISDTMAGHVPLLFDGLLNSGPHIKAGKLRGYAVNTRERQEFAPEIPTFRELGYPDMEVLAPWVGIFGPKDMPPALVKTIDAAIAEVLASDEYKDRMKQIGAGPRLTKSPEELQKALGAEVQRLGAFVKQKGLAEVK
jgi:tripartite-type tricarboxylate transporter receptor subunit TctC